MGSLHDRDQGSAGVTARPGDAPEDLRVFFGEAIDAVYPYIFRRCGHDRATAEDLCQDTFVTAIRTLAEGRVEVMTVGWLVSVARSRFIDHCRREARRERSLRVIDGSHDATPEDEVVAVYVATELLAELPATQRMHMALHHLDGMSVPEIAVATGSTRRSVESSLARARRKLRDLAEDDR